MTKLLSNGDLAYHSNISKSHGREVWGIILDYIENENMYLVFVSKSLTKLDKTYSLQYWFAEDVKEREIFLNYKSPKSSYIKILQIKDLGQYIFSPYTVFERKRTYFKEANFFGIDEFRNIQNIFNLQQILNKSFNKQGQLVSLKTDNNIIGRLYSYYEENELGELELFTIGRWCYFFYKDNDGQIVWSFVDPLEVNVIESNEGYDDLKFDNYNAANKKYKFVFLQTRKYLKEYCELDDKVAFPF